MTDTNPINKINELIQQAETALSQAKALMYNVTEEDLAAVANMPKAPRTVVAESGEVMKVIEGIFDGQNMIGPDGKQYSVPANYASKSKLVDGDTLKLTITKDGSFVYKQIGPVERKRLVGELVKDSVTDEYQAQVGDKTYRLLLASITYFKGDVGDEIVILVPINKETNWAAVENIIKKIVSKTDKEEIAE
ncbi:MAG: hypothetical protein V1838_01005 [Patescibacteria group bacterium]